jgi:hypothetical protein
MPSKERFDHLLEPVLSVLEACSEPMTEFSLIERLREQGVVEMQHEIQSALGLFSVHFTLFHVLYRLQQQERANGRELSIHCLGIGLERADATATDLRGSLAASDVSATSATSTTSTASATSTILPTSATSTASVPVCEDPLASYYLDLAHLDEATEQSVTELINRFWSGLDAHEQRAQALEVLGLVDPVEDAQIRLRYRRLLMREHPDRGGDTATVQKIIAAYKVLEKGSGFSVGSG